MLGTQVGCACTTFALFLYYTWSNKKRTGLSTQTEESFMRPEAWSTMTDRENKNFRYAY